MDPFLSPFLETLKAAVPALETRPSSGGDYLELVLAQQEVQRCHDLLQEAFGAPIKEFGIAAKLDPKMRGIVDRLGGIRMDQCLFLKPREPGRGAYAALWPWASNPARVTLKVGLYQL